MITPMMTRQIHRMNQANAQEDRLPGVKADVGILVVGATTRKMMAGILRSVGQAPAAFSLSPAWAVSSGTGSSFGILA
jgi:hypothetical protein